MYNKPVIIVLILLVLGLCGFLVYEKSNKKKDDSGNSTIVTPQIKTPETTTNNQISNSNNDWRVVSFPDYGFRITLNNAWSKYRYTIEKEKSYTTIRFSVPTTDAKWENESGKYEPLYITIYTKEYWNWLKNDVGPQPIYIKESDKYVYAYSYPQDLPSDLEKVDFKLDEVVKSLEILP